MGEVYRAHDTRLNRDVAIKVLLPEVADNPERLARFRREAQILASLNHPNIGHIYGLEESEGVVGLVLELAEGPTLADRVAKGSDVTGTEEVYVRRFSDGKLGEPVRLSVGSERPPAVAG